MKAKQVYDSIDQSKATKEVNAFLEKVKTATKNFTVENESVDKKMNELYEKIKATKPDILKGYKEPKAAKEPKAPRATTSKPRTPRAKKPARKPTVSSVAKKIRKKGESWNDALKRASSVFKEQQEDKRLKSREAMQELQKFMNDDKFKNWPRTYGKEKASGNDLMRDNARKAKAPGKRVSKSGRVYWENRDNRSDREASAFPRKIYLKDGGDVDYRTHNLFELGGEVMVEPTILQNNPDYITSTATMSDYFEKGGMMGVDVKKRFDVDFYKNSFDRQTSQEEIIRGDKFSDIVAQATKIAKSKGMNRVEIYYKDLFIGSMRMEDQFQFVKGRSSSKSPLPVDEFAKGGKLKYDPSRDVEAIVIKDGPFPMLFKRDDFIGGAYEMEKGGLSENYYYFSPRSILFARLKTGEEIKPVNGFWIKKDATGIVYVEEKAPVKVKKKSALGVSVPRPIMVSGNRHKDEKLLKMLNDFTASDALRPAMTFVALKDGEIVATDAHRLIRLIDGSTAGMNEGVCMKKLCSGINYKELNFPSYKRITESLYFDKSEDYDLTDLYQKVYAAKKEGMAEYDSKRRYKIVVVELELKNETISFNAELLLSVIAGALKLGWKNAFISYIEGARGKAVMITEERPSSMRGFEGKDLILLMPMVSGGDFPTKKVKAEEVFELGGEVMVEPTILQNNPDYITSTATMGEWFEKGGQIGFEGLARKVAKRYEGKPVPSDYQSEYGKTYSKDEAMEVGRKVAAKVYRQQQAKMALGGVVIYKELDLNRRDGKVKKTQVTTADNYREALEKIKELESKNKNPNVRYFTGDIYREKGGIMAKGGGIYSSDKAWSVKVMLDDQPVDTFMVRGRNLKEARMMVEDYHEAKMEAKYGDDIYFAIEEAMAEGGSLTEYEVYRNDDSYFDVVVFQGNRLILVDPQFHNNGNLDYQGDVTRNLGITKREFLKSSPYKKIQVLEYPQGLEIALKEKQYTRMMAKGGALYHRLMPGDEVLEIYKDYLIIENDDDFIYVIDFRPEVAKRIQVEEIEGENTIEAAKRVANRDFEYSKYAMGGSLYTHGLEEGDLIVEDEGAYINVLSEDGKIYYVDLGRGERSTEPPLPFEHGGEVKIGDLARLAKKYNKTAQEVADAIREGAAVEKEHTDDQKKAMRIAVDHLDEDFYYYPKLKAAEGQVDYSDFYEKGGQVPEQFLDSKGERKIDRKSIAELTDYVMALPQTKSIYFNEEAGEYVPSRRKLHADIINTFKKEVVCITEGQPIAIFMGGSPASGKSSFLRKYSPYLLKEEILKVDADEIRAMLPEYEGYNAAQTHLETKDIVNTLLSDRNIGIPCDFDLIYDGTMNSVKSYIPLMDILRKRGYKIFIVYMDKVPKDVIIKRALERYQKSGRFVPLEVIEDFFEKGRAAFDDLKKDVDGYMVIDGSNQDYEIIERGGMKLPTNREYSKLGTKIDPKDIPVEYKRGGMTKKA